MARTAFVSFSDGLEGLGRRSVPSIPVTPEKNGQVTTSLAHGVFFRQPWMSGAWTASLQNGFAAPGYTGTSGRPMAVNTEPALTVVDSREALPWTVLMPRRLRRG